MTWKEEFKNEYKQLQLIHKQIKKAVQKGGVKVYINKYEFLDNNPEWTTRAEIEAVRYVGGKGDTIRKVTIWYGEKYEAVQNENSDMWDTDYDSIATDNVDELIKFINEFLH